MQLLRAALVVVLMLNPVVLQAQFRAAPPPALPDAAIYSAIRDKALASHWAYERLADLTDLVGPRLSGSPQAQAAVELVAAAMRSDGLKVSLEPMLAPHWVRGEERGTLIEYAQRPRGITQTVKLTALGGSVATPEAGLTAEVLLVHSFAELSERAKQARGRIVVFDVPFDQGLADTGHAGEAYGQAVAYRVGAASAAGKLGAVAALIRSVGGADYRLPHTGMMVYEPGVTKIPAGALTSEDVQLISRLSKRGPVRMHLVLTPAQLPDVPSFNVVGELTGAQKPDEVVLVSGHLDSWDLATGAIDDGAGVAAAMGALHVLRELKLRPKRSIRAVGFMSEECGVFGGKAYFEAHRDQIDKFVGVIESDFGAARPLGFEAYVRPEALPQLRVLKQALSPFGAAALRHSHDTVGADISPLEAAGVPGFELMLDGRHYFDLHHTPADTLDKVDPAHLARMVASLAILAYYLADSAEIPAHLAPVHDQ
jgi:hypothetical protein